MPPDADDLLYTGGIRANVFHHRVDHPATTIMFEVDFYNQNVVIFKDLFNRACICPMAYILTLSTCW